MDIVADFLTCIRNAVSRRKPYVDVHKSKFRLEILRVLGQEGFISSYRDSGKFKTRVFLKYKNSVSVIKGLLRVSKLSLRIYEKVKDKARRTPGIGVLVLSTSKGLMSKEDSRKMGVGGEVIFFVW